MNSRFEENRLGEPEELPVLERPGTATLQSLVEHLSVFAVTGLLLLMLVPEVPLSIRLLLTALVFLTLKRWGGILVLILVQGDLFLREGRQFASLSGGSGIVFGFMVLGVLMFVARRRMLLQQVSEGTVFGLIRSVMAESETAPREQNAGTDSRSGDSRIILRFAISALKASTLLFCIVVTSRAVLGLLPTNRQLTGDLRQLVAEDPGMTRAVILIVAVVSAWLVVSEISWRQLTASQARMYLRSVSLKLLYRDLRMIVVRRLKVRQQRIAESRSRKS